MVVIPTQCYARSCDLQPHGQLYWNLYDEDHNSIVGNVFINLDSYDIRLAYPFEYDLSNSGIVPGKNYTISFSIFTEDHFDTQGNCVMIDNVRYDTLMNPFSVIFPDGQCKNGCDPTGSGDYIQCTLLKNGQPFIQRIRYSDKCGSYPANLSSKCDGTTLFQFNDHIAEYERLPCQYGCANSPGPSHCMTFSENGTAAATAPPSTADEFLNIIWDNIILIISSAAIMVICVAITIYAPQAWPMAVMGMVEFTFVLSILQILPIYFALAEIVFAAAIIAYLISKTGASH
jgi:hypothetical protein